MHRTLVIDLYYWPTPNGKKITIYLEEAALPHRVIPVNLGAGEQFKPEFLQISPNNRMPAIVDHEPANGGPPISVFESGAILQYLGDKTGKLFPRDVRARVDSVTEADQRRRQCAKHIGQPTRFRIRVRFGRHHQDPHDTIMKAQCPRPNAQT